MKFNNKGQGALEYLLLIGGAVLIAVIVIALLVGMGSTGRETAQGQANTVNSAISGTAIPVILNTVTCTASTYTVGYMTTEGTHQLVVDDAVAGSAALDVSSVTAACPAAGRHTAVIRTTVGTSVATSNQVSFNV